METVTATDNNTSPRGEWFLFSDRTFSLVYWSVLGSYFFVKFVMRAWVLEHVSSDLIHIFVLSYPNFCEAVIGSFVLVNLLWLLNERYISVKYRLGEGAIYFWSYLFAAVYVITQELKIHNLGGKNVYDPYDVLFSVIGLMVSYILLRYVILR